MDRLGEVPVGRPLPPLDAHAITSSIPTWKDFIGYREGDPFVMEPMLTGYPRFVIHALVAQLVEILTRKEGQDDEKCMLFPTASYAYECKAYLLARSSNIPPAGAARQERFSFDAKGDLKIASVDVHAVFYPDSNHKIANEFWQHTGFGISSRLAQRCLDILGAPALLPPCLYGIPSRLRLHNNHHPSSTVSIETPPGVNNKCEKSCTDPASSFSAIQAKTALRSRLAEIFAHYDPPDHGVQESDIFLYPTGVTAIWHAHKLLRALRPTIKCVCFGFPYLDTLKILEKWGPGCHFLGHDPDANLKELEDLLSSSQNVPPFSALFCEIPSNPLLQSPPIDQLRILADRYDFLIVVDDTIGSSMNVNVLPYADIVVTSLSKFICGYANAMGGSLILNPRQGHYQELKAAQISSYEDAYFEEDAVVMERNSRDFTTRMRIVNSNTNVLCKFLRSRSLLGLHTDQTFVIKEIFYPKWISRQKYDICRVRTYADGQAAEDNFGGLFSLTFTSPLAACVFHDALPCAKGPSLGTNFTLVCPYAVLAHYGEREWAAEHGIDENLVRVSVGLEDPTKLLDDFGFALGEAEKAVRQAVKKSSLAEYCC